MTQFTNLINLCNVNYCNILFHQFLLFGVHENFDKRGSIMINEQRLLNTFLNLYKSILRQGMNQQSNLF